MVTLFYIVVNQLDGDAQAKLELVSGYQPWHDNGELVYSST